METRPLPAETGKADAETLSRVVPLQKPPRRANLPLTPGLQSATRPARARRGSDARAPARDSPSRPGTVASTGDRSGRSAISVQRSSGDLGSTMKFTRSGVCTLSHTAKRTFRAQPRVRPHPDACRWFVAQYDHAFDTRPDRPYLLRRLRPAG